MAGNKTLAEFGASCVQSGGCVIVTGDSTARRISVLEQLALTIPESDEIAVWVGARASVKPQLPASVSYRLVISTQEATLRAVVRMAPRTIICPELEPGNFSAWLTIVESGFQFWMSIAADSPADAIDRLWTANVRSLKSAGVPSPDSAVVSAIERAGLWLVAVEEGSDKFDVRRVVPKDNRLVIA